MPNWLATTMSVLAGGVLTMLAGWMADRRVAARERERRHDERQERLINRRNDFQRATLLDLQDASQKLARNAGASLHQDMMALRRTGKWQTQQLPDTLSNGQLQLTTQVMLLASRVRNDDVRQLAEELRNQTGSIFDANDEHEAANRLSLAATTQGKLIQRIGEIVRALEEAI